MEQSDVKMIADFSDYIIDRTRDFTGREWVFREINDWLQASKQRVFLLTGGPGSGKSALAARLIQMSQGEVPAKDYPNLRQGSLTFFHFCQASNDKALNPLRFVEALSQHIARRYQPFANALTEVGDQQIYIDVKQTVGTADQITGVVINSINIGNLSARVAFDRLVRRPLEQLCTPDFNDTIVILVDALDEALTYDPDENILTLLRDATDHAADLPANVRILLTSRPDPRVLSAIGKASLDLIDDAPDDIDEVRDYTYRRLSMLPEQRQRDLADLVADAAEANFLYARYVLDDLLPNIDQMKDLSGLMLPDGLDDIYRQFLKRELGRNLERWEERYRPLLGVLAVARGEGLTREQLVGVTGLTQSKTDDILRACAQYLAGSKSDGPFHIYHQSFREFLLTDDDYQVYPAESNQTIADFFMEEYAGNWLNCEEDYALQYIPNHLIEAMKQETRKRTRQKLMDDLFGLLTDFNFVEVKTGRLGVGELRADLRAVLDVTPSEYEARTDIKDMLHVLDHEAHNLRGWDREQHPAFFAQQVLIQALDVGLTHLMDRAEARLIQLGKPYLTLLWRAGWEQPVFTLSGHEDTVNAVAVTPDSRQAISASADGTLKVWDLQTGQEVHTLTDQGCRVTAVAFTPDGRQVITGSDDGTIKVWDLPTWQEVHTIKSHEDEVTAIVITSDGRQVITSSYGGTIKVWDMPTWQEVRTITDYEGADYVAITSDGRQVILMSVGFLCVFDLQTGQEVCPLTDHEDDLMNVSSVAITSDGHHAIFGLSDGTIKVWDLQTGEETHTFVGHVNDVNCVAITPDGRRVISASGYEIKVWDLRMMEACTFIAHEGWVLTIAVTSDGRQAVSASWDGTLKVWDMQTGKEVYTLTAHEGTICTVVFTPNGRQAAVSEFLDGMLNVWDLQTGQKVHTITHWGRVNSFAVTPDGRQVITRSDDGTINVWDLQTGQKVHTLTPANINVVVVTPDGRQAISGSLDNMIKVWDLETGEAIATMALGEDVFSVAVAPDGVTIMAGDGIGNVYCLRYVDPKVNGCDMRPAAQAIY